MRKDQGSSPSSFLGLTQRQIALSCSIGQSTVSDYLSRRKAGLKWPEVADWDEDRLEAALLPRRPAEPQRGRSRSPTSPRCTRAADAQTSDAAIALAGVPRGASGRLRLQPLLRPLPRWRRSWTSCCARSTGPARSCSSTTPGARFRSRTRHRRGRARPPSSWPCSAPATTPSPRPPGRRGWPTGSARICAPSSSSAACPRSSSRTT